MVYINFRWITLKFVMYLMDISLIHVIFYKNVRKSRKDYFFSASTKFQNGIKWINM